VFAVGVTRSGMFISNEQDGSSDDLVSPAGIEWHAVN